jgi:hypothetical protein
MISLNTKFNIFLWQKSLSNFVSLPLKLDNPYYHNIQTRHQAKWQAYDKLRQMKYSTPFWLLYSQHTHKQLFWFTYFSLTLLHFYLDFGFYSTIYSGLFIYCKHLNVPKLSSPLTVWINCYGLKVFENSWTSALNFQKFFLNP